VSEIPPELDSRFTRGFYDALEKSPEPGSVLILPPDLTRIHSRAGPLTAAVCRELSPGGEAHSRGWSLGAIMPALGTHRPLTAEEIARMFSACPADKFLPHRWHTDVTELGRLEAEWVEDQFTNTPLSAPGGNGPPLPADAFAMDWPVQVNRCLPNGIDGKPFSLIVSIGQVVPHEVAGMANHGKNIFIGTGGEEAISKSHWLGALFGLERLMGLTDNPVRSLFDEGLRRYADLLPPILWVLTVVDKEDAVRGLFTGFDRTCFEEAAALSRQVNIEYLSEPVKKAVVWLDPGEYRSCWLGNKAIYRSRPAIADGGELVILAPGLDRFGEDPEIDAFIRSHGYRGASAVRNSMPGVRSLAAAAHLIHGSSEGRFTIRYCTGSLGGAESGGGAYLSRQEIEGVGYEWGSLVEAMARYFPAAPRENAFPETPHSGWRTTADGERYYFIGNPGLGLWGLRQRGRVAAGGA
jgi:nickel-dependent lactate racemase